MRQQDWQQLPTTCKVVLVKAPSKPFAAGDRIQVQWKKGKPQFTTVAPPHVRPGDKFQALVPAAQCVPLLELYIRQGKFVWFVARFLSVLFCCVA